MSWLDVVRGWFRDPSAAGRAFDARWGVETRRFDLGNYEPTPPDVVDAALDALDVDPGRHTFVDLGSGKGRVVLLASQRPFVRVVGVELREGLHRIAEANVARFRALGGAVAPIALLHGDVALQPLPSGPLVVFLYNPFPVDVLLRVLGRLEDREARLVYVNPLHHGLLVDAGWVAVDAFEHPDEPGWSWVLYRPSRGSGA